VKRSSKPSARRVCMWLHPCGVICMRIRAQRGGERAGEVGGVVQPEQGAPSPPALRPQQARGTERRGCLLLGLHHPPTSPMRPLLFACKPAGMQRRRGRVTNLQGPPLERTQSDKIRDLKSLAQQYARDRGSCDNTRISYLEFVESEAEANLTLVRMIAG
jgi:hypothetical protein